MNSYEIKNEEREAIMMVAQDLKDENTELKKALKPFAKIFEEWTRPDTPGMLSLVRQKSRGDLIEMFRCASFAIGKER